MVKKAASVAGLLSLVAVFVTRDGRAEIAPIVQNAIFHGASPDDGTSAIRAAGLNGNIIRA
jgi:hypothetical protein